MKRQSLAAENRTKRLLPMALRWQVTVQTELSNRGNMKKLRNGNNRRIYQKQQPEAFAKAQPFWVSRDKRTSQTEKDGNMRFHFWAMPLIGDDRCN